MEISKWEYHNSILEILLREREYDFWGHLRIEFKNGLRNVSVNQANKSGKIAFSSNCEAKLKINLAAYFYDYRIKKSLKIIIRMSIAV